MTAAMGPAPLTPFESFRSLVRSVIEEAMLDRPHRSSEGYTEFLAIYPNLFDADQAPSFQVKLFCSVLGGTREHLWVSVVSMDDAILAATQDLLSWIDAFRQVDAPPAEDTTLLA